MSSYAVRFTKSAQKELQKLPPTVYRRIAASLVALAAQPRKGNVRPMVGSTAWRLRVGDYRIVYDIHDNELVVLVIRIRHRKDAYRK